VKKLSQLVLVIGMFGANVVLAQPAVELELVDQIPFDVGPSNIRGLAVDSQDRILVLWQQEGYLGSFVSRCDQVGECVQLVSYNDFVISMTVDSQDRVILGTQQMNDLILSCEQTSGMVCQTLFGGSGTAPGQFDGITGLATDDQDRIIASDYVNDRIQICERNGNCSVLKDPASPLAQFCGHTETASQFCIPESVAVNSQGYIIVDDSGHDRIVICDDQGECSAFGSLGAEPGQFDGIGTIAVDNNDRIIVSEINNHRIQVCNNLGECKAFYPLNASGEPLTANYLTVNSQNQIIASEFWGGPFYVFQIVDGFKINAGLNDSWFNLATAGQGFLITVFPDRKEVFLAWFTFDTERPPEDVTAMLGEPGHRWLTAQGLYDGDTANLTIFVTEGGVFDAAAPIAETDLAGDGTITIEFADCTEGLVNYEITSLDISGVIPIQRISPDNVALCETLASP